MPVLCRGREAPDQYSVRAFPNRWPALAEGRCEVVLYTPEHGASFLLSAQKVPVRSLIFGLIEQRLFPHSTMLNLFSSSKIGVPKLAPRSLTHTARFTHLITYHAPGPSIRSWLETRYSTGRSIHSGTQGLAGLSPICLGLSDCPVDRPDHPSRNSQ